MAHRGSYHTMPALMAQQQRTLLGAPMPHLAVARLLGTFVLSPGL
jgi:hypothetical protein